MANSPKVLSRELRSLLREEGAHHVEVAEALGDGVADALLHFVAHVHLRTATETMTTQLLLHV